VQIGVHCASNLHIVQIACTVHSDLQSKIELLDDKSHKSLKVSPRCAGCGALFCFDWNGYETRFAETRFAETQFAETKFAETRFAET
jgi:hypothetical protein